MKTDDTTQRLKTAIGHERSAAHNCPYRHAHSFCTEAQYDQESKVSCLALVMIAVIVIGCVLYFALRRLL